jgi:hypothetical protein
MKKILVTMLALSLAVVSTVDAKITRGGAARGAMAVAGGPVAKNIDEAAANLNAAPLNEKDAAFAELVDTLGENEDLQELIRLEGKRAKLVVERDNAKNEATAKKSGLLGWFGQSDDYKAASNRAIDLNKQLADVNRQIKKARKEADATPALSIAIYAAMGSIATIMGIAALERIFGGETGYVGRSMTYTGGKMSDAGTWTKEQYKKRAPARLGGTPVVVK